MSDHDVTADSNSSTGEVNKIAEWCEFCGEQLSKDKALSCQWCTEDSDTVNLAFCAECAVYGCVEKRHTVLPKTVLQEQKRLHKKADQVLAQFEEQKVLPKVQKLIREHTDSSKRNVDDIKKRISLMNTPEMVQALERQLDSAVLSKNNLDITIVNAVKQANY